MQAEKNSHRPEQALKREVFYLSSLVHDWASWDDTHAYMQSRARINENNYLVPEATFQVSHIHLIMLLDSDRKQVWSKIISPATGQSLTWEEITESFPWKSGDPALDEAWHDILPTPYGPLMVVSRPILSAKDRGPSMGLFIMGRFLDRPFIKRLEEQTGVPFELIPVTSIDRSPQASVLLDVVRGEVPVYIEKNDKDTLSTYSLPSGLQQAPTYLVKTTLPRDIYQKGLESTNISTAVLVIVGIILVFPALVLLNVVILKPIRILSKHVRSVEESGDLSLRLNLKRRDEIGSLARRFDSLMEKLSSIRSYLLEQSYMSGLSGLASDIIHQGRNTLMPLASKTETAKLTLTALPCENIRKALEEIDAGQVDLRRPQMLANSEARRGPLHHNTLPPIIPPVDPAGVSMRCSLGFLGGPGESVTPWWHGFRISSRRMHILRKLVVAMVMQTPVVIPQTAWCAQADEPRFSLGIDGVDASEDAFSLDLAELQVIDTTVEWQPDSGSHIFELESSIRDPLADPAGLKDLSEELADRRWPKSKTRMEAHLREELLHQLSGGAVGYYQDGALFDVMEVISLVKSLMKSINRSRQPLGSRVARTESLVLHVRESDGATPESIAVLPMTLGWVGDVVVAGCSASGECIVDGLPDEPSTLLIRGFGAGLTMFFPGGGPQHVILKENGILKLLPQPDAPDRIRVRLTHDPTGIGVPVIRWLNPNRGEWVAIPREGLPVLLPRGEYIVEWTGPSSAVRSTTIEVEAGISTDCVLPPDDSIN